MLTQEQIDRACDAYVGVQQDLHGAIKWADVSEDERRSVVLSFQMKDPEYHALLAALKTVA